MSYEFPAHESTRKRRRWGCTCGCVMLLVVLAIVAAVFSVMGLKPHEEFPRYAMIDGETDGFGVLRVNPEDEGMKEFTTFLFQRMEQSYAPDDPNQAKVVNAITKFSKNILSQFVQPETMFYFSYNPATADEDVVISVPLKNRFALLPIRAFIQENVTPEPATREGIAEIYALSVSDTGSSKLLSLDPNEVVYADSHPLLVKSLEYARDETRFGSPTERLQQFIDELALDQPPDGQDLAIAFINEESRIINMIHLFEEFVGIDGIANQVGSALSQQQLSFEDISGLKITADLASADELKSEITMYCPNPDTATRLASVFETALPKVTGEQANDIFTLEGSALSRGATVVVTLDLTGIKEWMRQLLPVAETPPPDEEPAAAEEPAAEAQE